MQATFRVRLCSLFILVAPLLTAQTSPVTQVMATLSVKPGAAREQIMRVMPEEVRATVRLYLDGKIQQWYARADGKGVVFILSCPSVAEAKALTDTLPLVKSNLAEFEFMALSPLTPLRILLGDGTAAVKNNP